MCVCAFEVESEVGADVTNDFRGKSFIVGNVYRIINILLLFGLACWVLGMPIHNVIVYDIVEFLLRLQVTCITACLTYIEFVFGIWLPPRMFFGVFDRAIIVGFYVECISAVICISVSIVFLIRALGSSMSDHENMVKIC